MLARAKEAKFSLANTKIDKNVVMWGFRFFLGREPTPQDYVVYTRMRHAADFQGQLLTCREFSERLQQLSAPNRVALTVDSMPNSREAVSWAFYMVLGREPESESAINANLKAKTIGELRHAVLTSNEFQDFYRRVRTKIAS